MRPLPGRKNAPAQAQTVTGATPVRRLPGKKAPPLAGQTSPRYPGQSPIRLRSNPVKNPPCQTAYSGIQHEFVDHPTEVADFFDADELSAVYYPEVERLVRARTGARRVHVFDHTLRSGDEATRNERLVREPVGRVHNDYTEWSGPNRVRELLPDEADALLERRFAIVQVWRAIRDPIQSDPLAICDARSLAAKDLLVSERRYPHRVGQTYQIAHNPAHEWYYFPRMARDEALVFKVYDSDAGAAARFTAHTAFRDPATTADSPPRESIETRTFAFF